MTHVDTRRAVWSAVFVTAAAFVALDIAALVVIAALSRVTSSSLWNSFELWMSFHWPALATADALLPRPQDVHEPMPLTYMVGFVALLAVQPALIGALLGWILAKIRRRRYAL